MFHLSNERVNELALALAAGRPAAVVTPSLLRRGSNKIKPVLWSIASYHDPSVRLSAADGPRQRPHDGDPTLNPNHVEPNQVRGAGAAGRPVERLASVRGRGAAMRRREGNEEPTVRYRSSHCYDVINAVRVCVCACVRSSSPWKGTWLLLTGTVRAPYGRSPPLR